MNILKDHIQQKAQREEEIVRIMCVFPVSNYQSNPTYEQVKQFVERAETRGYQTYHLWGIFVSGDIPPVLDALIKELARNWRPAGNIVDVDESKPKLLA